MRAISAPLAVVLLAGCVSSVSPPSSPVPSASAVPTDAPTPTPAAAVQNRTISVGGVERSYRLVEPLASGAATMPLLVALHSFGGGPEGMMAQSRFADLAASDGVLVAFPAGVRGSWNAGSCCGEAVTRGVDDVGFIRALITELAAAYPVDPDRVFVAGFSNGAMMAYRVGCELSGVITAIAVVAGAQMSDCAPTEPVSLVVLHGVEDSVVPYPGGEGFVGITYPPVPETVATWAAANGCDSEPMATSAPDSSGTWWTACSADAEVRLIAVPEQGHLWFYPEPDASAEIWDFFESLSGTQ